MLQINTKKLSVILFLLGIGVLTGCSHIFAVEDSPQGYSDGNQNYDEKIAVSDNSNLEISEGGDYYISGSASNCSIIVNSSDSVILHLDSLYISNKNQSAIKVNNGDITIDIEDDTMSTLETVSSITDTYSLIDSKSNINFKGKGILKLENKNGNIISCRDLDIDNTSILLLGANGNGIYSQDITINKSYLYLYNIQKSGIVGNDINITKGDIHVNVNEDGIYSDNDIKISNTNLFVESGRRGISCDSLFSSEDNLTINSKCDNIYAYDTISIEDSVCFIDFNKVNSSSNDYIYKNIFGDKFPKSRKFIR